MARGGATNQRDAARGLGVLAPGGEHHPASCPAGKVLCLDGAYPGGWTAEEETNGSAISRRPRAPTKSRRHPGLHEIAPAIRGPRKARQRSGVPTKARQRFRWVVSWGGFVGWSREAELPPGQRRRVTHLASGKRSPHSPEIVDRFTLSASGNRWAL